MIAMPTTRVIRMGRRMVNVLSTIPMVTFNFHSPPLPPFSHQFAFYSLLFLFSILLGGWIQMPDFSCLNITKLRTFYKSDTAVSFDWSDLTPNAISHSNLLVYGDTGEL